MALRKKLYYPCRFEDATAGSSFVASGGALSVIGAQAGSVVRFVGGTGPNNSIGGGSQFFGAAGDRYGGVMDPNLFAGVAVVNDPSGKRRAAQAVSANFQCSSANAPFLAAPPPVCLDFVAPTGAPLNAVSLAALPSIDPVTVARPWVRLKAMPSFPGGGSVLEGMLYISRQHSMEV